MDAFAQAVTAWHDFYHLIGDAAGALMGLLFVSLSLNADRITLRQNAVLRLLAAQTFTNFFLVLLFSAVALIPNQGPHGLGLPLVGLGAIGLYMTARRSLAARNNPPRPWGKAILVLRFAVPAVCFLAVMMIGVSVLFGQTDGLYWLVPVMILLIMSASFNAWDLLLRIRETRAVS